MERTEQLAAQAAVAASVEQAALETAALQRTERLVEPAAWAEMYTVAVWSVRIPAQSRMRMQPEMRARLPALLVSAALAALEEMAALPVVAPWALMATALQAALAVQAQTHMSAVS
jgi:hypothetical protein